MIIAKRTRFSLTALFSPHRLLFPGLLTPTPFLPPFVTFRSVQFCIFLFFRNTVKNYAKPMACLRNGECPMPSSQIPLHRNKHWSSPAPWIRCFCTMSQHIVHCTIIESLDSGFRLPGLESPLLFVSDRVLSILIWEKGMIRIQFSKCSTSRFVIRIKWVHTCKAHRTVLGIE